MRIAVLADPHVAPSGTRVGGIDTAGRLAAALATLRRRAPTAELLAVLGDLVEDKTAASYAALSEGLAALEMPFRLLVGNHDDRALLRAAFPGAADDGGGHVQSVLRHRDGTLLFLDTVMPGTHGGGYTGDRLDWLRREIAASGDAPLLVFMHHPPFPIGTWIDRLPFEGAGLLLDLLAASGRVRHILAGHAHRACSGTWQGLLWTLLHGLGPQAELVWGSEVRPGEQDGPAHLAIVDLLDGNVTVHLEEVSRF